MFEPLAYGIVLVSMSFMLGYLTALVLITTGKKDTKKQKNDEKN